MPRGPARLPRPTRVRRPKDPALFIKSLYNLEPYERQARDAELTPAQQGLVYEFNGRLGDALRKCLPRRDSPGDRQAGLRLLNRTRLVLPGVQPVNLRVALNDRVVELARRLDERFKPVGE